MPWTLWRYILFDIGRSFIITTAVLVTVIAFGAAIKPLAEDHLLGAWQAMKYICFALVPMLQFALPFSGGFAATLTMHRMASDRELVAAVIGGISYRKILVPVVALGLAASLFLVALTQIVIPRFWTLMERTITADIVSMFEASIGRGMPFEVGNMQIFADEMSVVKNPDASDADTRIRLLRLAAVELDDNDQVVTDITAHQAAVDVYFREGQTVLQLVLDDAVAYNGESRAIFFAPTTDPEGIVVPGFLDNDPATCTRRELIELMQHPERFPKVDEARRDLARMVRAVDEIGALSSVLERTGEIVFNEEGTAGRRYRVQASRIKGSGLINVNGAPILMLQEDNGEVTRTFEAETVALTLNPQATDQALTFDLTATNLRVSTQMDGVFNERSDLLLRHLVPPVTTEMRYDALSCDDLLSVASQRVDGSPAMQRRIDRLALCVDDLMREARSNLARRYAMSATAILLITLGAILAILLRESPPLTVYLWAFLPSILDLVLISGGEQMIQDGKSAGLAVMWSGNALLLTLCVLAFRRISRH
ncbi:MAG: LptF/LptG family permease [Planctomycetota bacterium]